jgi:hypothetical protein
MNSTFDAFSLPTTAHGGLGSGLRDVVSGNIFSPYDKSLTLSHPQRIVYPAHLVQVGDQATHTPHPPRHSEYLPF